MSMVVRNNIAAQLTLGELNKNITKLGKALAKVASGMKINSAGDEAAQYSISESMRVRIRALEQATQNVQNGNSLLRTAEEGIQQQIDLVRTIKEKVIDAANDTNTDQDRLIIQKEINQFYDQIDQVAYYTDYNTQKPLIWAKRTTGIGQDISYEYGTKEVPIYIVNPEPSFNPQSVMNVIDGYYPSVEQVGSDFDTFAHQNGEYTIVSSEFEFSAPSPIKNGNGVSAIAFEEGLDNGEAAVVEIDFSSIDIAALQAVEGGSGLRIQAVHKDTALQKGEDIKDLKPTEFDFILTTVTPKNEERFATSLPLSTFPVNTISSGLSGYNSSQIIDISGYTDPSDLVSTLVSKLSGYTDYFEKVESNGSKLILTSANKTKASEKMGATGFNGNTERWYKEYEAADGSGTIKLDPAEVDYIQKDTGIPVPKQPYPSNTTTVTITNGPAGFYEDGSYSVKESGTYKYTRSNSDTTRSRTYNFYGVKVYSTYKASKEDHDIHYNKVISSFGQLPSTATTKGKDPDSAHVDINLAKYNGNVELLISDFTEKAFQYEYCYNTDTGRTNSNGYYYEFYDSKSPYLDQALKFTSNYNYRNYPGYSYFNAMDLNNVREDVKKGKSVAESFAQRFQNLYNETISVYNSETKKWESQPYCNISFLDKNGAEFTQKDISKGTRSLKDVGTIRINSRYSATRGNMDKLTVWEGNLSHYDIDFNTWFDSNTETDIPSALDGKGFRFYCGTDEEEWFNIVFRKNLGEVPPSLDGIKTLEIDVSKVYSAEDLVNAIYNKAKDNFKDGDKKFDHYYRFAKDRDDSGILTVYDSRAFNISNSSSTYRAYQRVNTSKGVAVGTKIADGVIDNVEQVVKELPTVDRIVQNMETTLNDPNHKFIIQDTDKADMNLQIKIPDMRLDSIFSISDWSVDDSYVDIPEYTAIKNDDGEIIRFERTITNGKVIGKFTKLNIREYSLALKADRDALLGDGKTKGILDNGIDYLLDAAVMVGAQRARLEFDQSNLVTQTEDEMSAESTIRDADMAKEMTEYTKMNVLSQSAQAMLAQANQNSSAVLSLLQ